MDNTTQNIIIKIKNYIISWGGNYNEWYCGIASEPRKRLFEDHAVKENGDGWIFRDCGDDTIARRIEDYFVKTLRLDGDLGGGDESTKFVYVYKKSFNTIE